MSTAKIVEIIGGPKDGQRLSIDSDVLVIPEPSTSIADWIEDLNPDLTKPLPTFREVRYTVMDWHGRLCAVHPGAEKL